MPAKKRRVTFDPEVRPSSASSPPPLMLANYPPIVTKKDIENVRFQFDSKSILKNPPDEDKPYESLCNFLIDLPPPPSNDLLSLDILQQETVFKPNHNRIAQLKKKEKDIPFYESDSSEDDSEDDVTLSSDSDDYSGDDFELPPETIDDVNENDVVSLDIVHKPKSFESSILLEQNVDEKSFYIKGNDDLVIKPVEEVFLFDKTVDILQTTPYNVQDISNVIDDNILLNKDKTDRILSAEHIERSPDYIETENIETQIIPSNSNVIMKIEESMNYIITNNNGNATTQNNFLVSGNDNIHTFSNDIDPLAANTLIQCEPALLTAEPLRHESESNLIESQPSQFISSSPTNILCGEISIENITNLIEDGLGNDSVRNRSEQAEQVVQLDNNTKDSYKVKLEFNTSSKPFHDETQIDNTDISNTSLYDSNNLDLKNNQIETKQRRRSGKKGHRKNSRTNRSASREDQVSEIISVVDVIALQEQKAAEAQARFKRFLTKMSGKAMTETQNLNYAGEAETLEPHMRDSIKESQILIWIYNMIDEAARIDFEFFLKDGCILCKLMNRIVPGCIPEDQITWEGARSKQKNISNFLREAEKYGVPKARLFFPEDMLHLRHIPRVTRCIYALAKIAQEDAALGEETPQLGDEPSFLKEVTTKIIIPGHRDTKDVLAQLTASKDDDKTKKLVKHSLYK